MLAGTVSDSELSHPEVTVSMKPALFSSLSSLLLIAGCASTPDTVAHPESPAVPPAPKQAAFELKAMVDAPAAAEEGKAAPSTPSLPTVDNMPRLEVGPEFAQVMKSFEEKYFFAVVDELKPQLQGAQRGQLELDVQLQVFAMLGQAHHMMDEPDKARRMYNRVLVQWKDPFQLARSLRQLDDGDAHVARAFDAFGEALFFLAETQRARVDALQVPFFDGSHPVEMQRFVERSLGVWMNKRMSLVARTAKAYARIEEIKPEVPQRWLVAAESRVGAMHAQTVQALRELSVPATWKAEGESEIVGPDGQKQSWESIRAEHDARVEQLMEGPLQAATLAYGSCRDRAAEHGIDNAFAKSCREWLTANGR